jgi:glycosyltransferase involved in cell wall biosynthesis
VIPNGFDPDRFLPVTPDEREAVRRRWKLEGQQVVLYPGSLSLSNHPIGLLLDAFARVRHSLSTARLLLVGGGEDYDRLAQAICKRELDQAVVMTGRIDPAQVPAVYAASEVVVDPVYDDEVAQARSPLKIVESLACGVPVVTSAVGDRAAMLDQGQAGVLVTPGNGQALAEGILSVLIDRAYHAHLSAGARTVSPQFRWDRLVHEFAKIYEA